MQLFRPQEIQAMIALLNRTPMTAAEQLFAQQFFQRLVAFCQPSPEPVDETLLETEKVNNGHTGVAGE